MTLISAEGKDDEVGIFLRHLFHVGRRCETDGGGPVATYIRIFNTRLDGICQSCPPGVFKRLLDGTGITVACHMGVAQLQNAQRAVAMTQHVEHLVEASGTIDDIGLGVGEISGQFNTEVCAFPACRDILVVEFFGQFALADGLQRLFLALGGLEFSVGSGCGS